MELCDWSNVKRYKLIITAEMVIDDLLSLVALIMIHFLNKQKYMYLPPGDTKLRRSQMIFRF